MASSEIIAVKCRSATGDLYLENFKGAIGIKGGVQSEFSLIQIGLPWWTLSHLGARKKQKLKMFYLSWKHSIRKLSSFSGRIC